MSTPLWGWSAVALAGAISRREISAREAVASCLERIDAANPAVNAVVKILSEESLLAADLADERTRQGEPLPPLHGVPVTVKINTDVQGHATTAGVVAFKDNIATEDSACVRSLRRAGAIIIGQTNCPAFAIRYFTDNDLHGATLNPWNRELTPGGSSGGAAVAVATGMGPLSQGNDTVGSVRYPAYCCGVLGIRPTLGRVASYNPSTAAFARGVGAQLTNVDGLMARHVADLRRALPALATRDRRDPTWVPAPLQMSLPTTSVRVALWDRTSACAIDPLVTTALERAAQILSDAGYQVERAAPPHEAELVQMLIDVLINDCHDFIPLVKSVGDDAARTAIQNFIALMRPMQLPEYSRLLARREQLCREWTAFLERYPVILMPNTWRRPFAAGEDLRGIESFRDMVAATGPLSAPAILGLPGISVPIGSVQNAPLGVQIVADRFCEALCLDVAEALEVAAGVLTPIDPQ